MVLSCKFFPSELRFLKKIGNFGRLKNAVCIRLQKFRVHDSNAGSSFEQQAEVDNRTHHTCVDMVDTPRYVVIWDALIKTNYQSASALLLTSPERRVTNETTYSTWFSFITICYLCFRFCYLPPKDRLQKEPTSRVQEPCLWRKVLCGDLDWNLGFLCRSDIFSSRL